MGLNKRLVGTLASAAAAELTAGHSYNFVSTNPSNTGNYWYDYDSNISAGYIYNSNVPLVSSSDPYYYDFDKSTNTGYEIAKSAGSWDNLAYGYSLEYWIYIDDSVGTKVLGNPFFSTNQYTYVGISTTQAYVFENNGSGSTGSTISSTGDLPNSEWMHLVYVRDANGSSTGWKIYKNGSLIHTGSSHTMQARAFASIYAFRLYSYANKFDGRCAEHRFYPAALTSDEVLANYNATKSYYI